VSEHGYRIDAQRATNGWVITIYARSTKHTDILGEPVCAKCDTWIAESDESLAGTIAAALTSMKLEGKAPALLRDAEEMAERTKWNRVKYGQMSNDPGVLYPPMDSFPKAQSTSMGITQQTLSTATKDSMLDALRNYISKV